MDNTNPYEFIDAAVELVAASSLTPLGKDQGMSVNCSTGKVPDFNARKMIPDRKNLKLMTQSVRLGVACIADVVSKVPEWDSIPPSRRGIYVAASPQVGNNDDLQRAIDTAYQSGEFSISEFGSQGIDLIHPLWLVRGLSNNVLGFSSAYHDIQGHNMSYAMGVEGGWNAITEGIRALLEHRVDIVVAGGSDDLTMATDIMGEAGSEGAAFFVFRRSKDATLSLAQKSLLNLAKDLGLLGAATIPVGLALQEFSK